MEQVRKFHDNLDTKIGKSALINTIDSCLSSRIEETVPVGGSLEHVTLKYHKIQFQPRTGIKFNIFDTWGVSEGNYEGTNLLNYFLDGAIPENFPMEKAHDTRFVQETVKNSSKTAQQRQIHAVIMFIKADTDQNSQDSHLMRQYISNCTAKGDYWLLKIMKSIVGYNVILAVTGVNKISPQQHKQQRETIFQSFGVPKSRIVFVEAYFEVLLCNCSLCSPNLRKIKNLLRKTSQLYACWKKLSRWQTTFWKRKHCNRRLVLPSRSRT